MVSVFKEILLQIKAQKHVYKHMHMNITCSKVTYNLTCNCKCTLRSYNLLLIFIITNKAKYSPSLKSKKNHCAMSIIRNQLQVDCKHVQSWYVNSK